jgi:hypothetical protein
VKHTGTYERFVGLEDIGRLLSEGWGWNIEVESDFFNAKNDAVKQKAREAVCLLAYIASKEEPLTEEKFRRVKDYLEWVDRTYRKFIEVREANHGKCPNAIKSSFGNSLKDYSGNWSRFYKEAESGQLQVIDGMPYYYGHIEPAWFTKTMMRDCIRRMGPEVRKKYDAWMKKRVKK